jgi:hypothetical protein
MLLQTVCNSPGPHPTHFESRVALMETMLNPDHFYLYLKYRYHLRSLPKKYCILTFYGCVFCVLYFCTGILQLGDNSTVVNCEIFFITLMFASFCHHLVVWSLAVCVSRVLLGRHHLLDVACGVLIGT